MRLQYMCVATVLLSLGASSSTARGEWIQWASSAGGNDHWYQAVASPGGITYNDAVDASVTAGGWLVTVTSAEESTFVFELVDSAEYWITTPGNAAGPWLGAYQPPGSPEPDGGWTWVTAEPWVYTNWASGEPNNQGGNQDSAMLWGPEGVWSDQWNDAPREFVNGSYVIEALVPEANTIGLLAFGALVVARRR